MISWTLPSVRQTATLVIQSIRAFLVGAGISAEEVNFSYRLALDEALFNALIHGNGSNRQKKIEVTVEVYRKFVRIEVTDEGIGFDTDQNSDPLDPDNIFRIGGRGLFLIEKFMDRVRHNSTGNQIEMIRFR